MHRPRLIRNVDAGGLLESFLVCGVAAILALRVYLEATGYPQVGGGGLHIAHLLWGGLAMLIAIVLLLAFLGKGIARVCAILGGLGFGVFIDELGKFITSDNNYLYRPTFAILYIIFVALFLWFRAIDRRRNLSEEEALVNALDYLKEAVRHDLDQREKDAALALLQESDQSDPTVQTLQRMLRSAAVLPNRRPTLPERVAGWAHRQYRRVVGERWFPTALIVVFVLLLLQDIGSLLAALGLTLGFADGLPEHTFAEWGDLAASAAFGALIAIGVTQVRRSRLSAYQWFRRAMLVSIFLSQVFSFYSEQLLAVIGVLINLLLLAALNYVIGEEEEAKPSERAPSPALAGD